MRRPWPATDKVARHFPAYNVRGGWLRLLITEQYVEDVVALLAAGLVCSRSGKGRTFGCRCDAISVDHPATGLDAASDQVLLLGGRGRPAINDVAAGEALRAEEAKTQGQGGG